MARGSALPLFAISAALRLCQLSTGYPRSIFLLMYRTLHTYMYRVSRVRTSRLHSRVPDGGARARASVAFKRVHFRVTGAQIKSRGITLASVATDIAFSNGLALKGFFSSSQTTRYQAKREGLEG